MRVQGDGQKRETLQGRQGRKTGWGRLEQKAAKQAKGKGADRRIEDRKMGREGIWICDFRLGGF